MKYKVSFRLISLVLILILSLNVTLYASTYTTTYQAPIYMLKTTDKTQVLLNDEFVVSYKFQPQNIKASDILPERYNKQKEIVMVIDTSGSMAKDVNGNSLSYYQAYKSRLNLAKNSAKNFLAEIEGDSNIKVAIVEYNTDVSIKYRNSTALLPVNNSTDYNFLVSSINNLVAGGGTNVGKGMYESYKLLQSGNTSAEKYFIFLTDGAPTYYTYYDTDKDNIKDYGESYYSTTGNTSLLKRGGTGSSDSDGKALNYGKAVGTVLKNSTMDLESYFVAFADVDAGNKLNEISDSADGHYRKAMTGDALADIYVELGEQMSSDISIKNVYFEETFPTQFDIVSYPDNMTKVGNVIKGEFGSINYNLNEAGTEFVASAKEFTITLKANTLGQYVLGANNSSYVRYVDLDDVVKNKYFVPLNINVYENKPPEIIANLSNSATDLTNYTLTVNIDEDSKLEILNKDDVVIASKLDGMVGDNTFTLTDLTGYYVKVRATDSYNNVNTETVPIVKLISLEDKLDAQLLVQTQLNSTISELVVNDVSINITNANFTDDETGEFTKKVQLNDGSNTLKVTAANSDGNSGTLNFTNDFQLDNEVPIIVPSYSPRFVIKDEGSLTIFIESNGTGSEILETHYMKLDEGVTEVTKAAFSGVIGTTNGILAQMTTLEIDAISKFATNKGNAEYKHEKFIVNVNGYYAVYAKDVAGNETVKVIKITNIIDSLPELL